MDAAQGRGWAVVKNDELHGMICFHSGDDSGFVAKQVKARKATLLTRISTDVELRSRFFTNERSLFVVRTG
jgi:hypothetical protein